MKSILKHLFVVVFCLISLTSLAGTIHPNVPDEKYLEYGAKFHSVYRVATVGQNNQIYFASCVVIDKRWALTAAHILDDVPKICVINLDESVAQVKKAIIHPDYDMKNHKADIALFYLDRDIELKSYPLLYEADDEVGQLCSMAGYGVTGNFLTGMRDTVECKKRGGSNHIDESEEEMLICKVENRRRSPRTSLEFCIAHGDSGGGLFLGDRLAGIHSIIMCDRGDPGSRFGEKSGHTRVSKFTKWIREIMESEKE